jgi:hypothetical protein
VTNFYFRCLNLKKNKNWGTKILITIFTNSLHWATKIKFRHPIVNTNDIGQRKSMSHKSKKRLTLGEKKKDFCCLNLIKKKIGRLTFLAQYSLYSLHWATKIKFYRQIVNTNDFG